MQATQAYRDLLLGLEEPLDHLSGAVSALELMVLGLEQAGDPYADGVYLLWRCLRETELSLQRALAVIQ